MRFRNLQEEVPATITVRLNAGAKTNYRDPATGQTLQKEDIPKLHTIHIPAQAEVEIEDHIWELAWAMKSTVPIYDREVNEVDAGGNNKHRVITPIPTGRSKTVYPIREMVKQGLLEVTEKPKIKLSKSEIIEAIENAGVPVSKDIEDQKLLELYEKVVG